MFNNKILIHSLSALLGILFIFSGLSKYYPIEPFEFIIVETGFASWKAAVIIARFIIVVEIALGFLLLFSYQLKIMSRIAFVLLTIFTLHLLFTIALYGNKGDCGCFGEILPMSPLQGSIKNLFLILISYFLIKSKYQWCLRIKYIPFYIFTLSFAFVFSQNAVDFNYSENYLNKKFENFNLNLDTIYNNTNYEKIGQAKEDIRNKKLILAFLSSECNHCKIAAKKLGIIKKLNPFIPFYFFINGDDADITKFKKENKIENINSSKLNGETFIQLAGIHLPIIYYYNKGLIEKQVDYYTLEQYHIEEWLKK